MNVLDWLGGHFSNRNKALRLYKRGMAKAKRHDHRGAIDDYTTSLGMADTPDEVKSMVLYNRALVYVAAGDGQKGAVDLDAILGMDEASANIKTMARHKLRRVESRSREGNK